MFYLQIFILLSCTFLAKSFRNNISFKRPSALQLCSSNVVVNAISGDGTQDSSIIDSSVSPPVDNAAISTVVAPVASKGFGKSVTTDSSTVDATEKGKRSDAKKKYQQARKIEKSASSLGNMMGTGKGSNDQRFKNQSYI